MHLHHEKHHNTYVTNLNAALEQHPQADRGTVSDRNRVDGSKSRRNPTGTDGMTHYAT